MSPQEADRLMEKRGFTLGATFISGIRMYHYSNIEKSQDIHIQVIPEREEFKLCYKNMKSINRIETPWCSSIKDKEHFKKILIGFKKWVRKIEELYEEE